MCVSIFIMLSWSFSPPPISAAPPNRNALSRAVEKALSEYFGALPPNGISVNVLTRKSEWAFGVVGIYAFNHTDAGPDSRLFIARKISKKWSVAIEDTQAFSIWLVLAPEQIVSRREKTVMLARAPEGDGSSLLSLVWATGETGTLTGGPHNNAGGAVTTRPWPAIDFVPDSRLVRAARDGIAYRPCANFVRVNHGDGWQTGYYHLKNIAIADGQSVSRGQVLGEISSDVGCGGSANGDHTHFTLRQNGDSSFVDINNRDLGGWTVHDGGSPYQGYMQRISDGNVQNAGSGRIYNNGTIGSGSSGPSGYTFCVNEGSRCNFSGTKDVAYGANGNFYYKYNQTGGVDCNNSTFGDPAYGVSKACYSKDSASSSCSPNSDQIALYVDGNYSGQCVVKGVGDYTNPSAIGLPNDSISSIKVGSNVKAKLCRDDGYNGTCDDFTGDDSDLGNNSIGNDQVSSVKVESRGQTGCAPNSSQIALFMDTNYGGLCVIKGVGDYSNPSAIGLSNDSISSIKVGSSAKAKLCRDDNFGSTCEDFLGDDSNLGDNSIGDNQVSSARVENRPQTPSAPTLSSPANGATHPYNYNLTFQWNASSGATEYLVEWWGGPYATMQPCVWTANTSCPIGTVASGNTYAWHVKARNSAGESGWSDTWTFTILPPPPSANFDAWPQSGTAPLTVAMHIVDTNNITSCTWNYGDGQTGTSCASSHNHVYNSAGSYTVRLDVTGPGGSDTLTRNSYINVQPLILPPDVPHDPTPADGAELSYRTTLDVSVQGEGDEFRIHVWGANYDRWRDWDASRSLALDGLTSQTYYMQAQARNSAGTSDWSSVWTFTIQAATPSNDDFAAATVINSAPFNTTQETSAATTAADDPSFTCVTGQRNATVWFKYIPPSNGKLSVNTIGSSYDTVLGIWNGTQGALTSIACDDDSGGNATSQVTNVAVSSGVAYYIEVAAFYSNAARAQDKSVAPELMTTGGTLQFALTFTSAPTVPQLRAPQNGKSCTQKCALDWTDVTNASYYVVQVRRGSTSGSIVASQKPTASALTTPSLAKGYWYFWRVRACNANNQCSGWTSYWKYKVP